MGPKDLDVYERRARARTSSNDNMLSESSVPLRLEESLNSALTMPGVQPQSKQIRLTLLRIILLNAVVCGVEVCACAGFTYIPPMLLKSGYSEENMSIILGLGPLLGFFIVPLIGRASDRCISSIGRRRPFILTLSVILLLTLLVIPYGDMICDTILGQGPVSRSTNIILMTIGVVLLDFTSQACLTPCEALLSDISKDTDHYERAFTVYSLAVSIGGFTGYLITAIDWNSTLFRAYFRTQEKTVFTILFVVFAMLLSATVIVAKEKPLTRQESDKIETSNKIQMNKNDTLLTIGNGTESGYDSNSENNGLNGHIGGGKLEQNKSQPNTLRSARFYNYTSIPKTIFKMIVRCRIIAALLSLIRLIFISVHEKLPEPLQNLFTIPVVLQKLAAAHFCSWTAVMGFNLFFTDFVANAVYLGDPNAPEDSYLRDRFDQGVRMGSWGLLLHCITSAVYALFVERLVDQYGCKATYMIGMASFSASMFGMVVFKNVVMVTVMAALTGFGYATLTTVPFYLVSKYHAEKEIYFYDVTSQTPGVRGIGTDMATLDSAYFLSQVVLSCLMGYIVHMTGSVLSYMVTAGVMGILSCYFIQNVITNKQELAQLRNAPSIL